ncbi:MAG: lamin tail domain-containing protein, partial [Bacteroidales bacterium]|nr:lamin tail domain-containing protein [Bacteroidales bacterium]
GVKLSPGGSWTFVFSGELDFSILPDGTGYMAFVYECTDANAGTWEIDNILYTGYPVGGSDATVTSAVYTVDDAAETITGVLYKSSLEDFEANLVPALGASFEVYEADGTTVATDIQSGYKVLVTAGDGTTTKTYTVTVDDSLPGGLFFSEYIEGSSNNKALEIYNPNDVAVRLDYYQIAQASNGGGWQYYHTFPAGTVLEPGEVWVMITDQTSTELFDPAEADEVLSYPSVVHHNGNDARGLIIVTSVDTTLVDVIGVPDVNPGTAWDVAGVTNATAEHTLVRKNFILEGTDDWALSAGTDAANSQWFVYEQNFFDSLGNHTYSSFVPSDDATVSSSVYIVNDELGTITDVLASEDLETFRANLVPAAGASFEVYEADGTTVATDLQSDYQVIVTAEDGLTTKVYVITKLPLSTDATVSSLVYTVDDGAGTITGVLYKSSLAAFEANLMPADGASFVVYQSDGTTAATDIQTGYKVVVTAEDGSTTKTYTVTVEDSMPEGLFFSEYIEGSSNNKALEVYNPNENPVRLDYYQIAQSVNGTGWQYYHIFPAGAVLEAGDVWVIITDQTDPGLFAHTGADEILSYPSVVHHNGDDARGLIIVTSEDTTLVDLIGDPDVDPGTGWDVAGVASATAEHTLVRKPTVIEGNTDWTAAAGTSADNSEWFVLEQNVFDSLGAHLMTGPELSHDATISDLLVNGTSIPGFTPAQLTYYYTLEAGTTELPVVTAVTNDENAEVTVSGPVNLDGTEAERTATVLITAEDGETTKTYYVVFDVAIGIDNSRAGQIMIYPVPAMDYLNISNTHSAESVSILNITGSVVKMVKLSGEPSVRLDIHNLNSGVYFLEIKTNGTVKVRRFVKD